MNAYAVQDAVSRDFEEFIQDVIFGLSTETLASLGDQGENEVRKAIETTLRKRSMLHGNGNILRA